MGARADLELLSRLRPLRASGRRPRPHAPHRKLRPPYLKLLRRAYGIEIWLVDGEWVRLHLDSNFAQATHGLLGNGYTPRNEIWIDSGTRRREWSLWQYHELVERRLMARGHGYDEAHRMATAAELRYRAHPRGLAAALRAERGC